MSARGDKDPKTRALFGVPSKNPVDLEQSVRFADRKGDVQSRVPEKPRALEDTVRTYLKAISTLPLLKQEEETGLAKQIERGKQRGRRALSRNPWLWERILGLDEEIRCRRLPLRCLLEVDRGGNTPWSKGCVRTTFRKKIRWVGKLAREFEKQSSLIGSGSAISPFTRQAACHRARVQVGLSRIIREIPFRWEVWKQFASEFLRQASENTATNHGTRGVRRGNRGMTGSEGERTVKQVLAGQAEAEQAKKRLVEANLRLVVSVAKRYQHRGLDLPDLIQEGNLGLMNAADRFDYRRGNKFSTCAYPWIRQAITSALSKQSRIVRLPVYVSQQLRDFVRARCQFEKELSREPRFEEVSQRMQIEVEKVERLQVLCYAPLSLDLQGGQSGAATPGDFLEAADSSSPAAHLAESEMQSQIAGVLATTLSPREEQVVRMRFGIGFSEKYSLEATGRELGLSREWIRQIVRGALEALRVSEGAGRLRGLLA